MLRPALNRVWSGNNSVVRRDPGATKYALGWLAEIPTFQVLNYLQYKMDTTMLAQAERGFFEWGSDVTYSKGAMAWDEIDKRIYVSQAQGPSTTLPPSQNAAQWKASSIQITRAEYDVVVASINAHIADVTGNPHQLTPGRLGAYTKAETDALVTTYRNLVSAHVNDRANPHATTASQVGAVPVTGGTYTGDVVFATGQVLLGGGNKVGLITGAGVYLQSNTGILGLNSAGVAVAGTTSAVSNIITESTFAAQKALVEPDYAIPAPVWYQPLIKDVNIYVGGGAVTTTDNWSVPNYDAYGRIQFGNVVGQVQSLAMVAPFQSPCVGSTNATLAVDFVLGGSLSPNVTEPCSCGLGDTTGRLRVFFRSNATLLVRTSSQTITLPKVYSDGLVHRLVCVMTSTRVDVYVDGVLISGIDGSNAAIINANIMSTSSTTTAVQNIQVNICNFRAWDIALSAKQVSNI